MKSNEIVFNLIGQVVHLTSSGVTHKGGSSRKGFVFIEGFCDETGNDKWRNRRVAHSTKRIVGEKVRSLAKLRGRAKVKCIAKQTGPSESN